MVAFNDHKPDLICLIDIRMTKHELSIINDFNYNIISPRGGATNRGVGILIREGLNISVLDKKRDRHFNKKGLKQQSIGQITCKI
jgi:exonuclease III